MTGDGLADLLVGRQNHPTDPSRPGAGALTILVGGPALRMHAATLSYLDLASLPPEVVATELVGAEAVVRGGPHLALTQRIDLASPLAGLELALGRNDLVPDPRIAALLIWIGLVILHYVILLPVAHSGRVAEATIVPGTKMRTVLLYAIASFVVFLAFLSMRMTNV